MKRFLTLLLANLVMTVSYAEQADYDRRMQKKKRSASSSGSSGASYNSSSSIGRSVVREVGSQEVQNLMNRCIELNGSQDRVQVGQPTTTNTRDGDDDTDWEVITKTCYDIKCSFTTGARETISSGSFSCEETSSEGACLVAWARNKCITKTENYSRTVSVDDETDLSGGADGEIIVDGGAGGSGVIRVEINGEFKNCRKGESAMACAKRLATEAGITERIQVVVAGDGLYRVTVAGGMSGAGVDFVCEEKKRVWYYLWLGKDWVESDCSDLAGTVSGAESRVAVRVDDGLVGNGEYRISGSADYEDVRFVDFYDKRVACSVDVSVRECLTSRFGARAYMDWENCADCSMRGSVRYGNQRSSAEGIISAVAQLTGAFAPAYFGYKTGKAIAGASVDRARECRLMQTSAINSYYNYITQNELPSSDPRIPRCNGYSSGLFAGGIHGNGYGGWGGPLAGAYGYNRNFLGLSAGPFAGIYSNHDVTGLNVNPFLGLHGQLQIPGISIGAGPGGVFGGIPGVNINGQFGGLPGGNVYAGGTPNFNFGGVGTPPIFPGGNPNFNFGGNLGVGSPWNYNVNPNVWGNANLAFNPQWNAASNGLVPWGANANVWNNNNFNGNFNGNFGPGGNVNGSDWWSINNSFNANAQANQAGVNFQQMALNNQANRAIGNANSNYNYNPAFSPMNIGTGFNANWGWQ